ncbi:TetR/AcrR family transcriptional regulator [Streptomyces sp. NPDC001351]|uniref:TetR/AcrR family transcriptional regulator n=1 Tax=Streptomyces sp. NPDC001351 TaxID=3364564 RepID=UPI0036A9323D
MTAPTAQAAIGMAMHAPSRCLAGTIGSSPVKVIVPPVSAEVRPIGSSRPSRACNGSIEASEIQYTDQHRILISIRCGTVSDKGWSAKGNHEETPITVAALLDAAFELFAEQGYGATSIADIAARAGLTKGAFYSNFDSKDALFLALFDQQWRERVTRLR